MQKSLFNLSAKYLRNDLLSGTVVFLIALPLCLGVALISGAPLFSGIIAGIIGGIVVGLLGNSPISINGPAAGLTTVIFSAIHSLGGFDVFLLALVFSGLLQIILGLVKGGIVASFFPSSVIKGLLAAIGLLILLKQLPHAFGGQVNPGLDFSFSDKQGGNTFTHLYRVAQDINWSAFIIAAISVAILIFWEKVSARGVKKFPAPLFAVISAIIINEILRVVVPERALGSELLVNIPVADGLNGFLAGFTFPDFGQLANPRVYMVAITIAVVGSLETLLNMEALEDIDPEKRYSEPNRQLVAFGLGNTLSGLIGGLPVVSVIVRSSVNVHAGARTKLSGIFHGLLLLVTVLAIPTLLNRIPLASLAGILLVTGYRLAGIKLFKQMYLKGWSQFIPFLATIIGIIFTDLLVGIGIGLAVGIFFVLAGNFRFPHYLFREKYYSGDVLRLELSQHVSFLNKAFIVKTLRGIPDGSHVVIDARSAEYIDGDILAMIRKFRDFQAPNRDITLSLLGFSEKHYLDDQVRFVTYSSSEVQEKLSPAEVVKVLKDGNARFLRNERINRDLHKQVTATANSQYPIAAILGCIDSRTSVEMIFDLGLGDVFSLRIAGNIANEDMLGSLEYACKVAGSKVIMVLGHTNCGAVKSACDHVELGHITGLLRRITPAVEAETETKAHRNSGNKDFVNRVTKLNVRFTKEYIYKESPILRDMIEKKEIMLVGAIYDVKTGEVIFEGERSRMDLIFEEPVPMAGS